jgi:hypothetical protein
MMCRKEGKRDRLLIRQNIDDAQMQISVYILVYVVPCVDLTPNNCLFASIPVPEQ